MGDCEIGRAGRDAVTERPTVAERSTVAGRDVVVPDVVPPDVAVSDAAPSDTAPVVAEVLEDATLDADVSRKDSRRGVGWGCFTQVSLACSGWSHPMSGPCSRMLRRGLLFDS
ncbi:Uncharacterised protein [Corynebacterium urealyticum]|nr:Uncharacterised protein [Corynebacterium urealyticum]